MNEGDKVIKLTGLHHLKGERRTNYASSIADGTHTRFRFAEYAPSGVFGRLDPTGRAWEIVVKDTDLFEMLNPYEIDEKGRKIYE